MHLEPNGAITPPSSYTEPQIDATPHTADSHATAPAPPGADVGEFDQNLPTAGNVDETLRGLATDLGGQSSGSLLQGAGAQATPSGSSGAVQQTLGAEAAAGELAPNPQSGQAKRKHDDSDYDPSGNLARLQKRSREEKEEGGNYPLEQRSGEAAKKGTELEVRLPSGLIASNIGRGDAPYISSNKGNYEGAAVKPTYDDMAKVLSKGGRKRQGQLAEAGLKMARNEEESVSTREGFKSNRKKKEKKEIKTVEYSGLELNNIVPNITPQEKRGLGQLVAITHLAEQHTNRTPSSGTLARASLTKIAEGHSTFRGEFNSKNGNYTPARAKNGDIGGTQMMKDMVEGTTKYQGAEDTAAYMSESDEDPGQLLAGDMSGSDSENDYIHRTTAKRASGVSGNSDQWAKSGADMAKFEAAADNGELVSDSGSVSAEETGSEEE